MSWNGQQNGQQQNGYNGQQQPRKIPDLGRGRLRKTQKKTDKSPDFSGLVNHEGQIIQISMWYEPARAAANGQMMQESWSVRTSRYDPNQQGQQAPQQQMQYPPQQPQGYQQPTYAQQAPGPAHAPGPQPPQHGGYAPAPGYVPPPPAVAPPQAPQWGGQPAQGRPPQGQAPQQAGYKAADVPF